MWARGKLADRETHFFHVDGHHHHRVCQTRCWNARGELARRRARVRLGKTGNKKLHVWAFDRIYQSSNTKERISGVEVLKENRWNTSTTCSQCGDDTKSNRKVSWPVCLLVVRIGSQRGL